VSQDTLAGIPWAGRSTLTGLFQRVATNGPGDPSVWRKLVARADVIAHSLTSKQASLMLSAMARAQQRDKGFLRRFSVKFAPSLMQSAELLDLCGIVSSLSQLDAYSEETFDLAVERLAKAAPQMDLRQLSLVANAYVRASHADTELLQSLLLQVPRRLARCSGKDVAVLLNALAQIPGPDDPAATAGAGLRPRGVAREHVQRALDAVALRLPDVLPSSDLHTLTLVLNAFAQLQFTQKDALDLLVEELLGDESRFQHMTPRQLAMVLNAAARLQLYEPRLLEALVAQVRARARSLDAQGLCVVANACAKLQLGVETFQVLYTQVPRHLARLTGRQLAMLCHAWAKAHQHNDDLFSLLALPLAQRASGLAPHEVAIVIYGYAHFKKVPPELFGPLLERFSTHIDAEAVSVADLLMVVNALGRVGHHDSQVAHALEGYVRREPSLRNLCPQALATFGLTSPS